jgi:hypothetical protein
MSKHNRFEGQSRYSSAAPEDIIRNERDAIRAVFKPQRPLTPIQRIGAVAIGCSFVLPFAIMVRNFEHPENIIGSGIVGFVYLLINFAVAGCALFGLRIIWNGLTGAKQAQKPSAK